MSAERSQASTTASGTGSPSPSKTRPEIAIAPSVDAGTSSCSRRRQSPIEKNGPTVWEGVRSAIGSLLHGRPVAAAEDDIEPEAERPLGNRRVPVERAHQPHARRRFADGL